ncbi:hypothetical protein SAMD00023353_0102890 [Rosellinia necatrix]|uniref:Uncharacterized protein n=1 Tax=Rosellinia necatrix TaxID=77044 RepID=A0A1S7UHX5_ROSNE|nr:hypothetical protein SAMD00023353_0102890 [Rosellinia necatrix]
MRTPTLLALALSILPTALAAAGAWPSCDPSCKSCGLYCNEGCTAPLVLSECNRCLYCRRESSSCGFVQIGPSSDPPPDPAYCAMCQDSCHCYIDAKCYDNTTTTASPSPSASPSNSAAAA